MSLPTTAPPPTPPSNTENFLNEPFLTHNARNIYLAILDLFLRRRKLPCDTTPRMKSTRGEISPRTNGASSSPTSWLRAPTFDSFWGNNATSSNAQHVLSQDELNQFILEILAPPALLCKPNINSQSKSSARSSHKSSIFDIEKSQNDTNATLEPDGKANSRRRSFLKNIMHPWSAKGEHHKKGGTSSHETYRSDPDTNGTLFRSLFTLYAKQVELLVQLCLKRSYMTLAPSGANGSTSPSDQHPLTSFVLKFVADHTNSIPTKDSIPSPYMHHLRKQLPPNSIILAFVETPQFFSIRGIHSEFAFLAHVSYYKAKLQQYSQSEEGISHKKLIQFTRTEAKQIYKTRIKLGRNDQQKKDSSLSSSLVGTIPDPMRSSLRTLYKKPTDTTFDEAFGFIRELVEEEIYAYLGEVNAQNSTTPKPTLQEYVRQHMIQRTTSVLQIYEQMNLPMLRALRTLLEKEYSSETMVFFEEALRFSNEPNVWIRKTLLQKIYNTYLSDWSSTPINVSSHAMKHTVALFENCHFEREVLSMVFDEVLKDLNLNYTRHVSSGDFEEALLSELRGESIEQACTTVYTPSYLTLCMCGRQFDLPDDDIIMLANKRRSRSPLSKIGGAFSTAPPYDPVHEILGNATLRKEFFSYLSERGEIAVCTFVMSVQNYRSLQIQNGSVQQQMEAEMIVKSFFHNNGENSLLNVVNGKHVHALMRNLPNGGRELFDAAYQEVVRHIRQYVNGFIKESNGAALLIAPRSER